ncbi:hypothetical protein E2C01_030722 [Portunus trituberculatus]|uniref:Uncharacterized protein n=1 Tax=Portunus trituberculatus TaxID=210409 RepID=A0A5B7EW20_PORTR|nr:hypothetical protein [Portunus trituberculatus]
MDTTSSTPFSMNHCKRARTPASVIKVAASCNAIRASFIIITRKSRSVRHLPWSPCSRVMHFPFNAAAYIFVVLEESF